MRLPNDAAAMPFPRLEQTPPDTKIYFLMGLNYPVWRRRVSISKRGDVKRGRVPVPRDIRYDAVS